MLYIEMVFYLVMREWQVRIVTISQPRVCLSIAGQWSRRELSCTSCRSRWQSSSRSEEYSASIRVYTVGVK